MVLICISLVISGIQYFFMCLLVIPIFSLEKCVFKSFVYFFRNWVVVLLLSCALMENVHLLGKEL